MPSHLISESQVGARECWDAIPNKSLGTAFAPAEFIEELRVRLRIPDGNDRWCPLCDVVMDSLGVHSRCCGAGGDRTLRHNGLRNRTFRLAQEAGANPEIEKPSLLLPECRAEFVSTHRPADVYLPALQGGMPVALDFAVTAPQRQDIIRSSSVELLAAAASYGQAKRDYKNTAHECELQGVTFQPMVVETSGAWSNESLQVLRMLAKSCGLRTGRGAGTVLQEFLQAAGASIRRANARAHLKRRSQDTTAECTASLAAFD